MIQPLDVALLAAIWRELERAAGDESEAAWAVWERMKSELPSRAADSSVQVPSFQQLRHRHAEGAGQALEDLESGVLGGAPPGVRQTRPVGHQISRFRTPRDPCRWSGAHSSSPGLQSGPQNAQVRAAEVMTAPRAHRRSS
jgi:hypothetical protein